MKHIFWILFIVIIGCKPYTPSEPVLLPVEVLYMNTEEIVVWCKKYNPEHYKKYETRFRDKLDEFYLSEFFGQVLGGRPFEEAVDELREKHPDVYERHKRSLNILLENEKKKKQFQLPRGSDLIVNRRFLPIDISNMEERDSL